MAQAHEEKERMRSFWSDRGNAWDRRADELADMADRLNAPLIEAIGIAPGHRVLDLASGAGEPALTVARTVGPAGSVVATDLVPQMLAGAQRRIGAAGLENVDFRIADMENLPFEDAEFDRVSCRYGIMFAPEPDRALAETRRVLRSGGRAGFIVWGPKPDNTMFMAMSHAARTVFGDDPRLDMDAPFSLAAPGTLGRLMEGAGFSQVEERELRFAPEVRMEVPFWRPQADMMCGSLMDEATEAERDAIDAAVREALEPTRNGDVYRLSLHIRLGLGDA
jgi:ubiquinone/menaquinone biosynthesis C-methylase UbiE